MAYRGTGAVTVDPDSLEGEKLWAREYRDGWAPAV